MKSARLISLLLVIDQTSGTIFVCTASYFGDAAANTPILGCVQGKVTIGTMPAGPAELSPFLAARTAAYAAIWKIDQNTGNVTFCGSRAPTAGLVEWMCSTAALP
jgi:hypothetical protein